MKKPISIAELPTMWDQNGLHTGENYEIPIDPSGPTYIPEHHKGTVVAMDETTITIKFALPRLRAMTDSN